jgi:uncharacterized protein (TIGR00661 family)
LSHQASVIDKKAPQPADVDIIGKAILKNYAPSDAKYGFHFKAYSENTFMPVVRRQVRDLKVENKGHYTVYLPSYDDKRILKVLKLCGDTRWQVFSKHNKQLVGYRNITIQPIDNEAFIESMASSEGVLCGAGFETPAEALFMNKKLMVIPMKGQFEQHCNAAALKEMGVPVLKSLKVENAEKIRNWIENGLTVAVDYPDQTEEIINAILSAHGTSGVQQPSKESKYTVKKFRNLILKKIIAHI